MDFIHFLVLGFGEALTPANMAFCLIGALLGTLINVLPGIGSTATIAVLLHVTFYLPPWPASSCCRASTTARSTAARPPPSS